MLIANFSRVMWISTGVDGSSAPSIEQSAMIFGRGKGRGAAVILEAENVILMEVDMVSLIKATDNVSTVDGVITSPRSAERNLIDLSGQS